MEAVQSGPVRVLSTDFLGDSLLDALEVELQETKLAKGRSPAAQAKRSDALATALRAALNAILGSEGRLVAVDDKDPLINRTLLDLVARVPPIVHARRDRLSEENIQVLVDTYLKSDPTSRARHAIEHDNARERARFVEDVQCLSSRDLATLAGHRAENSSATAARWKKAGRIFALPWRGADLFPAFQFVDGKPRAVIGALLGALPEMSPWQLAFWFTSTNSWLGGDAPVDQLEDKEAVLYAARREGEALAG